MGPELAVFAVASDGRDFRLVGVALPGGTVSGLLESATYQIVLRGVEGVEVFVDDVPLQSRTANSARFEWHADFFAGLVSVVVRVRGTKEEKYWLDVAPSADKLGSQIFAQVLNYVRDADQRLVLGMTPALDLLGSQRDSKDIDPLVLLERLRTHGPEFVKALALVSSLAHKGLRSISQRRPLSSVRKVSPSALRDRNLLLARGSIDSGTPWPMERTQVIVDTFEATFDTPANRTLKALLKRFSKTVAMLRQRVVALELPGDKESQVDRRTRRVELLSSLIHSVEVALESHPLRDVRDASSSAAGLTQISAVPHYARAFRLGCKALGTGVGGKNLVDSLPISPTWEIYERWCYLGLVENLGLRLAVTKWEKADSSLASADRVVKARLDDGTEIQVLFQPRFPSKLGASGSCKPAWSVSRERFPDIVIFCRRAGVDKYAVVDAKYRSGRHNVLDAMSSAHIYRDSLRIGAERPAFALLAMPGLAADEFLEATSTWAEHQVGTVSDCRPGAPGIQQLVAKVVDWMGVT